nr:hypothetical protein [Vibrio cincinnatiensis]
MNLRKSKKLRGSVIRKISAMKLLTLSCELEPITMVRTPCGRAMKNFVRSSRKKMFSNTEELLPVISFNAKTSSEDQKKHDNFVARMMEKGYTEKQVRLLSEWYLRVRKAS